MAQTISPFFRSPFTDLTGGMVSHHLLGRCQRQEIRLMDCLEAHGLDRGMRECGPLIDDYRECHTLRKQFQRFMALVVAVGRAGWTSHTTRALADDYRSFG
ncbi:unnamed protein product [Plutella xylostella]|uniref:(diamondback moth) hypothetical protein n=1 Tax=Plutella xylostella TaxID=51655 RepID=A0A8S4G0S0_PLUXY|nr:unnamed protein product [Plutella xylostella]